MSDTQPTPQHYVAFGVSINLAGCLFGDPRVGPPFLEQSDTQAGLERLLRLRSAETGQSYIVLGIVGFQSEAYAHQAISAVAAQPDWTVKTCVDTMCPEYRDRWCYNQDDIASGLALPVQKNMEGLCYVKTCIRRYQMVVAKATDEVWTDLDDRR